MFKFFTRDSSSPYIALSPSNSSTSSYSDVDSERIQDNSLDDEQEKSVEYEYSYNTSPQGTTTQRKRLLYLSILTGILTIINLSLFHQYLFASPPLTPPLSDLDAAYNSEIDLEFASAYIGFDDLDVTLNYTFENMPLRVGSVDRAHPTASHPEEAPFWWTPYGSSIIPARRHVFVNESISTIVQFRATDYGLETCRPTLVLPTFAALTAANSSVRSDHHKPRSYSYSAPVMHLHVWELESESVSQEGSGSGSGKSKELELDLARLSYVNLPPRKTYLGAMEVREGVMAVTPEAFECKSASLHTLELSCEEPGCMLDVWVDDVGPKMAFFVEQSATTRRI